MEIWKDIKGYEGLYQISSLGRVKSLSRKRKSKLNGYALHKEKILKPNITHKGYHSVGICKDNKRKTCSVHRLVAKAFISNPENKPQVNHLNGIKIDNNVNNLEWLTGKENVIHSINQLKCKRACGEKTAVAKLSEKEVLEIRRLYQIYCEAQKYSPVNLAKKFNLKSICTIHSIINRETWKHI